MVLDIKCVIALYIYYFLKIYIYIGGLTCVFR